jgi:hypothetical protein
VNEPVTVVLERLDTYLARFAHQSQIPSHRMVAFNGGSRVGRPVHTSRSPNKRLSYLLAVHRYG